MERRKKGKGGAASDLPRLAPEAEAALAAWVSQVAAACESGQDLGDLQVLLTPSPRDLLWDLHLMAALGHLAHPAIPALLAALFGATPDKVRRKALKKTLHILKTRGVPVPVNLLPREEVVIVAPGRGAVAVQISPVFGNGDSYLILEGPGQILGGNFLVCRISDEKGFLECFLLTLKRKEQEEFWNHFREQGLSDWFAPPGSLAVRLLEEAYVRNPEAESARRYASLRAKILKNWGRPEEAPDPEKALPPLNPSDLTRLLEQSRILARDPIFHSWIPGKEEILPWFEKMQEVEESPLVLSEQQKQMRADALLDEATRALYPPETWPEWRRRLLLMAYFLDLKGRGEDARAVQAAAADLAATERSPLAGESPFLKALVQYCLLLAWELKKTEDTSMPSGLVTPPSESRIIRG